MAIKFEIDPARPTLGLLTISNQLEMLAVLLDRCVGDGVGDITLPPDAITGMHDVLMAAAVAVGNYEMPALRRVA
jgi:hypothetical protein